MSFEAVTRFTLDVFDELYASQNSTGDVGFSGTALYILMGAIHIGLRGRSYDQLTRVLEEEDEQLFNQEIWENSATARKWSKFIEQTYRSMTLTLSLYYHGQLNYHYKLISGDIFRLSKNKIDASNQDVVLLRIKVWVFKNENSIRNWDVIEESISSEDKILFMSEILLVLRWENQFHESKTDMLPFWSDDGEEITVWMMSQVDHHYLYDKPENEFKILFKPFKENKLYAAIVLPKHGLKLFQVYHLIKWDKIQKYFEESISETVHLRMPMFTMHIAYDFVTTLKNLGVKDIFDEDKSDFARMTNRSVIIGNIFQVISFSLDEYGVNIESKEDKYALLRDSDVKFDVNRTFLFFIYSNKYNLVHFSAVVNQPSYI